ncbi:uncharacterized protein LOC135161862 [Diachasmimorpha longicaudata]|uniref:uncharacterized protein LOC135161862 n=1 Tax=Diachasmimorpha longicaudata TaxID=58733 RepID=UPI0030B8735A
MEFRMESSTGLLLFLTFMILHSEDVNCGGSHAHKNPTIEWYSRGSSIKKTMEVTEANPNVDNITNIKEENPHLPLEYGVPYKGLGKLSTPEECARTCRKGAWPKTCYYHFTVELYRTLGGACTLCRPTTNTSLSTNCQCVVGDGVDMAGIMVINRMYPGPSIQLCVGDLAIIDVSNRAIGTSITIHWHGVYQKDYQYYDGVPFVTQCPIIHGTTFRYRWRAQNAGTHFYHAHTGLHKPDGLEGAVIIRQPKFEDPNSEHFDDDNFDNVIFINDWFHESAIDHWPGTSTRNVGQIPQNILINGKGQWLDPSTGNYTNASLAVINVRPNRRIRFRLINSSSWTCPIQFTIQNHNLTLIGTDGEEVKPKTVTTITSYSAERYDFVLHTNQTIGTYWIQARLVHSCASEKITQVAILRYVGSELDSPSLEKPKYNPGLPLGIVFNDVNRICNDTNPGFVCVVDLETADPIDEKILAPKADISILLSYNFHLFSDEELFKPNTYTQFLVPFGGNGSVAMIGNISNVFSGSPYLTQITDIPSEMLCNKCSLPDKCLPGKPCFCSHIIHLPLNTVVEIIMTDTSPNGLSHPFHLHGFGHHVMAQGHLKDVNITETNKYYALELHRQVYQDFRMKPIVKDTLAVSAGGYTIIRFIADNPGYWLHHCHFMSHLLVGMELVFHVGNNSDLPPVPKGFPTCGDFKPRS